MNKLIRLAATLVAGYVLATQLSACFPVVAAGVTTGVIAATDRRTLGAQADDRAISLKAGGRISEKLGDQAHVNVTSYNRKVLLTGEVPSEEAKNQAEKITLGVENVTSVVNELAVSGASSLSSRSSDSLITGKVIAQLVDAKDLSANTFKVVTERGVVYLMGRVTSHEGARASAVARSVGGVQKVVKVFEYLSPEELANLQKQSGAPASSAQSSQQPTKTPASPTP